MASFWLRSPIFFKMCVRLLFGCGCHDFDARTDRSQYRRKSNEGPCGRTAYRPVAPKLPRDIRLNLNGGGGDVGPLSVDPISGMQDKHPPLHIG